MKLTYADREMFMETFDGLKETWSGTDEELLGEVSGWAKERRARFGFEESLYRDLASLSKYLLELEAEEERAIARGALLYVLEANKRNEKLGDFGLLDDAFVVSYAVHEIRQRLDLPGVFGPPKLTAEEMLHAEELFETFTSTPLHSDDFELGNKTRLGISELGTLAEVGLFRRMIANLQFLISVMEDFDRDEAERDCARAALSYFICDEDAIDDRLGIVGYIDDDFIAQLAVDLIEPAREPWMVLLDAVADALPFLNSVVLEEQGESRPLSEFAVVNTALICPALTSESNYTTLVLPDNGPVPFLVAFFSTLAQIQAASSKGITEESFYIGQRVLVDYTSVAEFAGFKELNGRRQFGLKRTNTRKGVKTSLTRYWPVSYLRRLLPVSQSRKARGQTQFDLQHSDIDLPILEFLFKTSLAPHISAVEKATIVVTSIGNARALSKDIQIVGTSLSDVVPIGSYSDGKTNRWTTRFGTQKPLLLVFSDVDEAAAYVEENHKLIAQVVVDASGRNADKPASLAELARYDVPTLVITPERTASKIQSQENGELWEWTPSDYQSLCWPSSGSKKHNGVIGNFERRLHRTAKVEPELVLINLPLADEGFERLNRLQAIAAQRGEDRLAELDEMLALGFHLYFKLLRAPVAIGQNEGCKVAKLQALLNVSNFLSGEERNAAGAFIEAIQDLLSELGSNNPKREALLETLSGLSAATIICPYGTDELREYIQEGANVAAGVRNPSDLANTCVIPGWYGKQQMSRLLVPPIAERITLVLYDIEGRWYRSLQRELVHSRNQRASQSERSKLFPGVEGWKKRPVISIKTDDNRLEPLHQVETVESEIRKVFRTRAERDARSDGSESELDARLVFFEGGGYAFLTANYSATVVTHLLDSDVSDDSAVDVKKKSLSELRIGDALLFHRKSSRDVIRDAADKQLVPGTREKATLWQAALQRYADDQQLSIPQLHERLRQTGCKVGQQTIRGWLKDDDRIAPKKYEEHVAAIAQLTKDESLLTNLDESLAAIPQVFGAHQSVSRQIARKVLRRTVSLLQNDATDSPVDLGDDVVIVRLTEINDTTSKVRCSLANRLQETVE